MATIFEWSASVSLNWMTAADPGLGTKVLLNENREIGSTPTPKIPRASSDLAVPSE